MASCDHSTDQPREGTLRQRLHHVGRTHLDFRRRAALRLLTSFLITFALIRLLTYSIHNNLGPFHDIVIGGGSGGTIHIHHYMWGLLLIAVCGFLALSLEAARWHPFLAIPFGIGLALVLDEFALLLQLKDVYWAEQGRISVDIGVIVAAGLLLYYLGQCYWHDVIAELRKGFGYVRKLEGHVMSAPESGSDGSTLVGGK
jgi:hypothetical protein